MVKQAQINQAKIWKSETIKGLFNPNYNTIFLTGKGILEKNHRESKTKLHKFQERI